MPDNGEKKSDNIRDGHWIKRNYASRSGLVRTMWHRLLYSCGSYKDYREIDWQTIERLVFVCKGNICRSVFAEAVAKSMGINAASCGLDTIEDAPANVDALHAASLRGFDLGQHRTRPIMYMPLKRTDLLVAMEPWQADFLRKNLNRKHQYSLLGLWTDPVLPHIQDPYDSSPAYFDNCFSKIQNAVQLLVEKAGMAEN